MGDVPDFVDEDDADVWEGGGTAYKIEKVVGNGAFGIVWKARAVDTGEVVAIKKVLLDRRYQNRELQMMKVMDNDFVVRLKHYYEKPGRKRDETFLQIVMEYLPDTLRSVTLRYQKKRRRFPPEQVQSYVWQMLKAMEYIHARRICHRDIKPDNLLVDPASLRLKLCDFGCSKVLVRGQPNISYICSRYYRAPELLFGATDYSCALDLWSVGTILAELLLGHLPFQGQDSTQQHLVEIMKLLGTPSARELAAMGATCSLDDLPKLKPFPWERMFPPGTPADAIDLVARLLCYDPEARFNAQQALAHPFLAGVSVAGLGAEPRDAGSPPRDAGSPPRSARCAQEVAAHTAAFLDELGARQAAVAASFAQAVEAGVLEGARAAGVPEGAHAALAAGVRAELSGAGAQLARHGAEQAALAGRMRQRVLAAVGGEGAGAQAGASEMDVDGPGGSAERERLGAVVAALSAQLREASAAQQATAEQLRQAQARAQQLEAERAMSAVAIHDSARASSIAVAVQTDEELGGEQAGREQAGFGRRATGRSYMAGFFSNNGIVPSPLIKRPAAQGAPQPRAGAESREGSPGLEAHAVLDGSNNLELVRPTGAISPATTSSSPLAGPPGGKWGLQGARAASFVPGAGAEGAQPVGEELVPSNRRALRRSSTEER